MYIVYILHIYTTYILYIYIYMIRYFMVPPPTPRGGVPPHPPVGWWSDEVDTLWDYPMHPGEMGASRWERMVLLIFVRCLQHPQHRRYTKTLPLNLASSCGHLVYWLSSHKCCVWHVLPFYSETYSRLGWHWDYAVLPEVYYGTPPLWGGGVEPWLLATGSYIYIWRIKKVSYGA